MDETLDWAMCACVKYDRFMHFFVGRKDSGKVDYLGPTKLAAA